MSKKFNAKDLVDQIERVAKERMLERSVVSLDHFRSLAEKQEPPCVLIIDDDETVRKSLHRLFTKEGYKVLAAADATGLSEVLEDIPPDIILLDVGLPWINGYELAQMIRQNEDLQSIPILFISGQVSDLDRQKANQCGASGFLEKPLEIKTVRQEVQALLKRTTTK